LSALGLEPLATTADAAAIAAVSERHLRRLIELGRFPAPDKRVGRGLRWRVSTLRAWVESKQSRKGGA
jgi:predicted DNA-binding transcriptional regulator AlpA